MTGVQYDFYPYKRKWGSTKSASQSKKGMVLFNYKDLYNEYTTIGYRSRPLGQFWTNSW